MSRVPPAKSIRVGAVASTARAVRRASPVPLPSMNPPMDCPRCGQAAVTEAACPRCGVIVAKARARKAPTDTTTFTEDPDPDPDPPSRINGLAVVLGGAVLLLAGAVGSRLWDRAHRPPPGTAIPGPVVPMAASGRPSAGIPEGPPPVFSTPVPPVLQDLH